MDLNKYALLVSEFLSTIKQIMQIFCLNLITYSESRKLYQLNCINLLPFDLEISKRFYLNINEILISHKHSPKMCHPKNKPDRRPFSFHYCYIIASFLIITLPRFPHPCKMGIIVSSIRQRNLINTPITIPCFPPNLIIPFINKINTQKSISTRRCLAITCNKIIIKLSPGSAAIYLRYVSAARYKFNLLNFSRIIAQRNIPRHFHGAHFTVLEMC